MGQMPASPHPVHSTYLFDSKRLPSNRLFLRVYPESTYYGHTSTNRSQSRQRAALHGSQDRSRQSSLEPEPPALGLSRPVPGVALGIARGVSAAAREPARRAPAADHGGGDAAAEAGAALLAEPAGAAVSGPGAGSGDRGARSRADLHALAALSDHQRPRLSPLSGPVAEAAGAAGEGGDWVRTAETGCRAGGSASRTPAPAARAGAGGREAQAAAPRAGGFAHPSQNRPPVSAEFPARSRSSARLRRHRTPAQSPTRARKARIAPGRIARERENGAFTRPKNKDRASPHDTSIRLKSHAGLKLKTNGQQEQLCRGGNAARQSPSVPHFSPCSAREDRMRQSFAHPIFD